MADEILVVTAFNATINAYQSFFLDFLSLLAVNDFEYVFDEQIFSLQMACVIAACRGLRRTYFMIELLIRNPCLPHSLYPCRVFPYPHITVTSHKRYSASNHRQFDSFF